MGQAKVYDGTNFRKEFSGSHADYGFLGDAGNFAYGGVSAKIGVPLPVAEGVAGWYALQHHPDHDGPYGMDDSATHEVEPGYDSK